MKYYYHGLNFHFYADDMQLNITFKSSSPLDMDCSISRLTTCVHDIDSWMFCNKLKLNMDKTEMLIISSSHRTRPSLSSITVCDEVISCSSDQSLSMVPHVMAICKSSFFHLHNIGLICKFITLEATTLLIHAFVTSKLDYCNSLLYGLPNYLLKRLQHVQNAAAHSLLTLSPKYVHITPILIQLHWLPIQTRVEFKILLITFKALHGRAPVYIKDMINRYQPMCKIRYSHKNLLVPCKFNLKSYGRHAFSVAAPYLWNSLLEDIKNSISIDIFKCKLKTFFLKCAFCT